MIARNSPQSRRRRAGPAHRRLSTVSCARCGSRPRQGYRGHCVRGQWRVAGAPGPVAAAVHRLSGGNSCDGCCRDVSCLIVIYPAELAIICACMRSAGLRCPIRVTASGFGIIMAAGGICSCDQKVPKKILETTKHFLRVWIGPFALNFTLPNMCRLTSPSAATPPRLWFALAVPPSSVASRAEPLNSRLRALSFVTLTTPPSPSHCCRHAVHHR